MDLSIYSIPLDTTKKQIRILELKPFNTFNDLSADFDVHCKLHMKSFEDADYCALSYTWGDPNENAHIFIEGDCVRVGKNLEAALSRL